MATSSIATLRGSLHLGRRRNSGLASSLIPSHRDAASSPFGTQRYSSRTARYANQALRRPRQLRSFATVEPQSSSPDGSESTTKAETTRSTTLVSQADMQQEETKRVRLSDVKIAEIIKAKHSHRWVDPVIPRNMTVQDVIPTVIEGGLSGMMVVDEDSTNSGHRRVVGLLTSRDVLRIMASGIKDNESGDVILNKVIDEYMTPISQVIYARPEETVGMCRTIMAKLGIKCLPVLSKEGRVEGLITARDMSDFGLSAKDKGGKQSYLNDVSERVGLSSDTSMAEPPTYLQAHLALEQVPLFVNIGVAELPHPFKSNDGSAMNQSGKHRHFDIK